MAQLAKNPPAMQEPWVQSLGLEDPLEKGMATWRKESLPTPIFRPEEFHGLYSHGVTKSQTEMSDFHFHWSRYCPE